MNLLTKRLLCLMLLCLPCTQIHTADDSDRLGQVQDLFRAPIPGVLIRSLDRDLNLISDETGHFRLPAPDSLLDTERLEFVHSLFHRSRMTVNWLTRQTVYIILIPREHIKEELTVTATSTAEKSVSQPVAESVVTQLEIREKLTENIVSALAHSPGVQTIGKGGYAVAPSIRGLARRRILLLIDGVRMISDRAVGSSLSFISPNLIQRIEVLRFGASVLYGSDAMGGVMHAMTPAMFPGRFPGVLSLSGGLQNERFSVSGSWGKDFGPFSISAGVNHSAAGDMRTPVETILNSGYTSRSGLFALAWNNSKRSVSLSYIGGIGRDVGKPERSNDPLSYSTSPIDDTHILQLRWTENELWQNGQLNAQFFYNPTRYQVDKIKAAINQVESATTSADNWGLKLQFSKPIITGLRFTGGLDGYFRSGVQIDSLLTTAAGRIRELQLDDGRRQDIAIFLNLDYRLIQKLEFQAGIRSSSSRLQAVTPTGDTHYEASSLIGFAALRYQFNKKMSAFFNLGQSFRAPGLTELYYSGISGRRRVEGNPHLLPEKSLNMDFGFKFFNEGLFLGLYGFSCEVSNLIERYAKNSQVYSYDNVLSGRISGAEIEFQLFPFDNLELSAHATLYRGEDSAGAAFLNDIPAPQFLGSAKWISGQTWMELNLLYAQAHDRPGPAESVNDAYTSLDLKGGWLISPRLMLLLKVSNLLNAAYYPNADPDITYAAKRDLSIGLQYFFD